MSHECVLVVGTTADYIDLIRRRFPGRALFLTDTGERGRAKEPAPDETAELLCDLSREEDALAALCEGLAHRRLGLTGVACFDCESMALASRIARRFSLAYPSLDAVAACRSKLASKQIWRRAGLPCPDIEAVRSEEEALRFMRRLGRPSVLKPLTGSGSELTFFCLREKDAFAAFRTMRSRLAEHPDKRMYAPQADGNAATDPRQVFAIEEFVEGTEYSCDFVLDGDRTEVIRFARKIPAPAETFGTTLAYVVPADLPPEIAPQRFRGQLRDAARSLGLDRALGMLDFIVRGGEALMLEMAPRPGGDCLPPLIRRSCGLDMLGCALDFAEGRPFRVPPPPAWRRLVGVRLFARRAGVVRRIDTRPIRDDKRVLECRLKHAPGHRVVLPPDDYDSRILGHVIFEPSAREDIAGECAEIAARLEIDIEEP